MLYKYMCIYIKVIMLHNLRQVILPLGSSVSLAVKELTGLQVWGKRDEKL